MTETSTIAFLLLISLMFAVYLLLASWLNGREIRRLREIKYKTQTQLEFGEARHKLFLLLNENQIKDDSITFLLLYMMNTAIMRNPDKYQLIAKKLRESFMLFKESSPLSKALTLESKEWSPQVKELVIENSTAMNSLMILHSPLLRLTLDIAKVVLPILRKRIKREFGLFTLLSQFLAKQNASLETFTETKEGLRKLVRCA